MGEGSGERGAQERYGSADTVIQGDAVRLPGVVAGIRPGAASMEPGAPPPAR